MVNLAATENEMVETGSCFSRHRLMRPPAEYVGVSRSQHAVLSRACRMPGGSSGSSAQQLRFILGGFVADAALLSFDSAFTGFPYP